MSCSTGTDRRLRPDGIDDVVELVLVVGDGVLAVAEEASEFVSSLNAAHPLHLDELLNEFFVANHGFEAVRVALGDVVQSR